MHRLRQAAYNLLVTTPAVCAWDGVLAVGFCSSCDKHYCASHEARFENWVYGVSGTYRSICAECLPKIRAREAAELEKKQAANRARRDWILALPPMTADALMAYVRHQVEEDDGGVPVNGSWVEFGGGSFTFKAGPAAVAAVLRQLSWPGPFAISGYVKVTEKRRHKVLLKTKQKNFTAWIVTETRDTPGNEDTSADRAAFGFALTSEGLFLRITHSTKGKPDYHNDGPISFFEDYQGQVVLTGPLEAEHLRLLRRVAGA